MLFITYGIKFIKKYFEWCSYLRLVSVFILSLTFQLNAQEAQEINLETDTIGTGEESQTLKPMYKSALKKAFHSTLLPSWGQINNKQTWKAGIFIPTIIGGFTLGISQNRKFQQYKTANNLRNAGESSDEYFGVLTDFELSDKLNTSKKRRNLGYALAGTTYGIQILDAYVFSIIQEKKQSHSPSKAAYYSAMLPGLGQIYNRKFWKLPIVYGALGISTYFIIDNTQKHNAFKKAYINFGVEGFEPEEITLGFTQAGLLNARQVYLRNVEVAWIVTGALYVANILDAVVDAHLFDFDVSDDLSIKTQPLITPDGIIGSSIVLKF